jgi:hypothetical protein
MGALSQSVVERLLHGFVGARFWIAPAYVLTYYGVVLAARGGWAREWPRVFPWLIGATFTVLIGVLCVAIVANRLWVEDYRSRLLGGVRYLRSRQAIKKSSGQAYEQARWSNGKMLAVTTVIMAIFTQYETFTRLEQVHQLPVLVVVMLVCVALFDSALDLEAESTICLLAASLRAGPQEENAGTLAELIWSTNQFRPGQELLFEILAGRASEGALTSRSFSAPANNIISFAIIIVVSLAASGIAAAVNVWSALRVQ